MHDCVVLCFIVVMCSFKYSWNVCHAALIKIVISKDYKVLNKAVEAKRRGKIWRTFWWRIPGKGILCRGGGGRSRLTVGVCFGETLAEFWGCLVQGIYMMWVKGKMDHLTQQALVNQGVCLKKPPLPPDGQEPAAGFAVIA